METTKLYSCEPQQWQDEPIMLLRDHVSGASAMVAPALGSNCVAWSIQHHGQEVQIIETPPAPAVLHQRASRGGIPVLWPFPGRVKNARYTYNGKEYLLPPTDKNGINHIHGLALTASWEVADAGADEAGAYLVTTLRPAQLPLEVRQAGYPFDFTLSIRFILKGQSLTYTITLENNETATALPFGFGIHPYFRVPLVAGGVSVDAMARTRTPLRIPAAMLWPAPGGIPAGPAQPVEPDKDFRNWRPVGTQPFDDMYAGVILENIGGKDFSVAGYRTPELGLEVQLRADANFQDWVLFTPVERASLAIEPYTSPPNAINSAPVGLPGSNLLELAAGDSWQAHLLMEVVNVSSDRS